MVLQLEYCTNILKSLHTIIDSIFLFYHPWDIYRGREDSFNLTKVNSGYDIEQQEMHPTNGKQEVG